MNVGISVTGAGADVGSAEGRRRLAPGPRLAGAGRAAGVRPAGRRPARPRTGDITIHLSCTLHMAQPPVERPRRVMYTAFALPPHDPELARLARARIRRAREMAPLTTSQPAAV